MKKTNKEASKKEASNKEMSKKEIIKKDLSPKELQLMECLWSVKKAKSVPKIVKLLSEKTQQQYAESTVRTFLTRIEKKGYVHRCCRGGLSRRAGTAFAWTAPGR